MIHLVILGDAESCGESETVPHRCGVKIERSTEQAGSETVRCHTEHLIRLFPLKLDSLVPDRDDARTSSDKIHEKILGFHWVIRAVSVHTLVMLRVDFVFDFKFGEHGLFELNLWDVSPAPDRRKSSGRVFRAAMPRSARSVIFNPNFAIMRQSPSSALSSKMVRLRIVRNGSNKPPGAIIFAKNPMMHECSSQSTILNQGSTHE
jgi:hypothetical protein